MNKSFWLHMGLILFFGGELVITTVQAAPTSYPQVPDNLPENLQAPKDQRLILKAMAKGSQIYTCQAKANTPNTFEWTL